MSNSVFGGRESIIIVLHGNSLIRFWYIFLHEVHKILFITINHMLFEITTAQNECTAKQGTRRCLAINKDNRIHQIGAFRNPWFKADINVK